MIKLKPSMFVLAVTMAAWADAGTHCRGHFIWMVSNAQGTFVYFGDGLAPDRAEFLDRIEAMRAWQRLEDEWRPLTFSKEVEGDLGWFVCRQAHEHSPKELECLYGVFRRGEQAMLLNYGAKYAHLQHLRQTEPSGNLTLDVVPRMIDGAIVLTVYYRGQVCADCEIEYWCEGISPRRAMTDESGQLVIRPDFDKPCLIRAKFVELDEGTYEGQAFGERRYYCTLVLDGLPSIFVDKARQYPDLPEGLTSFGAAVCGSRLYVFGGQKGDAHHYAAEWQNGQLWALALERPDSWQVVHRGRGLQGLGMVSHGGRLFRVGGFEARNGVGQPHDLHSVAEFAVFDFDAGDWRLLAPLPEPRSSFDACVVGDRLYVVGGWTLAAKAAPVWLETAWVFDLSRLDGSWKPLPKPPFQRRALALAATDNRLYAIGGMTSQGEVTRQVTWLDLEQGTWHEGPELPEAGRMEGFGSAAVNVAGRLIVSTYEGNIYELADDGHRWIHIKQIQPGRFFHRLAPLGDQSILLIGGANMELGKIVAAQLLELPASSK